MSTMWYYAHNDQQAGPVSWEVLVDLATSGQLLRNDLVWTEGMPSWVEAHTVAGLFPSASDAPSEPASNVDPYDLQPSATPVAATPQTSIQQVQTLEYQRPVIGGTPPPNYLWQSIAVTLCCCMPFGIVAIVYAAQVNGKFRAGDPEAAMKYSESANMWVKVAFFVGIGVRVIMILINVAQSR